MGARVQRELALERKIEERIEREPSYIKEFYYWMNAGREASTKERYIRYVCDFLHFCAGEWGVPYIEADRLRGISSGMLSKYVREISFKWDGGKPVGKNDASTVNTKLCALSTFYKFLQTRGVVEMNLCQSILRPKTKEKDEVVYLTQKEIREVMDALEMGAGSDRAKARQAKWRKRDMLLFILPLTTGIRVTAMADINIEDINMETGRLKVIEKERKERVFDLSPAIMDILRGWLYQREKLVREHGSTEPALFVSLYKGTCRRMTVDAISDVVRKYTSCVDKHITPHKLRATFATQLYEATGDIYEVAQTLGHKSPETTRHYVRDRERSQQKAMQQMSSLIGI